MSDLPAPVPQDSQPPASAAFDAAMEALSDQQQSFVLHYLRDPVGAKAARQAGYSAKNSKELAHHLLSNPEVAAAVELGMRLFASLSRVEIAEWLSELKLIAECDLARLRDHFDQDGELIELPGREHERRALKQIRRRRTEKKDGSTVTELTYEVFSKLDALRLLGTYAGFLAGEADGQQTQAPVVNLIGLDVAALLAPPPSARPALPPPQSEGGGE